MYFKVSTITPCHNGVKYLQDCWGSLKRQTLGIENMECIFVDDCSTDDTWEMLEEMEREYPEHVTIIRLPENRRQGGARNEALKYVHGEYVQFLDQDDWLEDNALSDLLEMAEEFETDIIQYDYVHPQGKSVDDMFCIEDRLFELEDPEDRKQMLVSGVVACSHHNHFYRRDLLEKTGSRFPEGRLYEEPLFVYPLLFNAERIWISTREFYNMRSHAESSTETLLADHLEDHPIVQKMTLDFLKKMPQVMEIYSDEIGFYFILTYYIETMINAGRGGKLSSEMITLMQKTLREEFPDYMENPYIKTLDDRSLKVLETVEKPFPPEGKLTFFF
ncbi:MAG: glycosyltransferase [Lachnospiraceae bacterium]|nr:glycosyltransferase [Lachnospiraceae bacterium]